MKEQYKPTIGLEIHVELRTKTKMFCNSLNDTDEERPNVNICPVCMGYPGSLPVINKEAVRQVLRVGHAVGGKIADYTEFDRKNYFYPDIPKGYQISQYKYPLITGGSLAGVALTRIHLEEDTAKSTHDAEGVSLLNFNRAGVPLMELVTEPVIHDTETASRFAKEFQLLLTYLEASHANMEKGEMRVEANISVSKDDEFGLNQSEGLIDRTGKPVLGTKVEVKNLNSFRAVEKAIKYEVERHIELLERGEKVVQETRGWDENKESTFPQRAKEDSHDYRYFPDPDLPKLFISEIPEFSLVNFSESLPELPWTKRERLQRDFGIKPEDAEIYVQDTKWGEYFEVVVGILNNKELNQLASNYITTDLKTQINPKDFVEVIRMVGDGSVSSRGAKNILKILEEKGGDPRAVALENNLIQKSDREELKKIVLVVLSENEKVVEDYKKGNVALLQFLIGQSMKASKGSGNPSIFKEILEKELE